MMKHLHKMDKRITNEEGHTKSINNNNCNDCVHVDDGNYYEVDTSTLATKSNLNLPYSAVGPSASPAVGVVTSQVNHCNGKSLHLMRVPSSSASDASQLAIKSTTSNATTCGQLVEAKSDKTAQVHLGERGQSAAGGQNELLTSQTSEPRTLLNFLKVLFVYLLYINKSKRPSIGRIIGVNCCLVSLTCIFISSWMAFFALTIGTSVTLQVALTWLLL